MPSIHRRLRSRARCIGASFCIGFIAHPLYAQQPPPKPGIGLEEVVVTARKREENLQEVPIAITAISAEELQQKSILAPEDLKFHSPGLEIRTSGLQRANVQYFIRGQGQTFGSTPSVVTYFSEAPLGNAQFVSVGNNGQLFDLASVQVLKGPQGTLFGRSTTGGAVLFTPQHPTDEFEGSVKVAAGNLGMQEYTGVLNVPLVDGVLNARLAANVVRRDGFTKSLSTGQELDDRHRDSYRLGFELTPTEWLTSYLLLQDNRVNENNTGTVLIDFNENHPVYNTTPFVGGGWFALALPPGLVPQRQGLCYTLNPGNPAGAQTCVAERLARLDTLRTGLAAEEARIKSGGEDAIRKNQTGEDLILRGRTQQILNITSVDAGRLGFLGEVTFKNIFNTVRSFGTKSHYDSGSPRPNGLVFNNYDFIGFNPTYTRASSGRNDWLDDFSNEFQILGTINERHSWMLGFYLEERHDDLIYPPLFSSFDNVFSPILGAPAVVSTFVENNLNMQKGYFGQFTLDLSEWLLDGLRFTGGYRWSETYARSRARVPDPAALLQGNLVPGIVQPRPIVDDQAPSWNVSFDYQINDDLLTYIAHRRGFKPGGSNVTPAVAVPGFRPTYDAETVDDIELGVKADWFVGGRPLRTNAAIFKMWYDNVQRSETFATAGGVPFTQTSNIAKAEIEGLELSALLQASDRLQLSLNYSYLDAKYTEWPGTVTNIITGAVSPLVDSPYVGTPEHQATLTVRYAMPLPEAWGEISALADYYRQTSVHLNDTELQDGFGKQDGYGNLNLRVDWSDIAGQPLDAAIFARNVLDDVHANTLNSFYSVVGTANAVYNEPRVYGAELRYRFGGK
jgi:iron complex outermembrane recepter protein